MSTPITTERREFSNMNNYHNSDNEDDDGDEYDSDGNIGPFTDSLE